MFILIKNFYIYPKISMQLTARKILKALRPILNQHWATYSIWANNFLEFVNAAVLSVWNYNGYIWKWQHIAEQITVLSTDPIQHTTNFPIYLVDRFFIGTKPNNTGTTNWCECPAPDVWPCDWYTTYLKECCAPLFLKQELPHNTLCDWYYQIAWWYVENQWGEHWSIVRIRPWGNIPKLYMTYFRHFEEALDLDEVIRIPYTFLNAIKYRMATDIIPTYWQYKAWQEQFYYTMFEKEIESLRKWDTIYSDKIRFDTEYPLFWDAKSNWTQNVF